MENYNFREKMREKNRYSSNSEINNPLHDSEFYISENDRLFGDNFATGEYLRRKQEIEKKKGMYKYRQNQALERERKRWERLDYEYLKQENQSMMNKERNMVGRKNNPGMAFNPLNLQYDNSVQGEILKRRDEESKYRAWLRSINMDKHGNTGYNIINGEERTILEERLNKDILPDLIQKNIDQINEMKNKVVFNYNNFYTRCNPSSPDLRGYRYDNNNSYNGNRINKSLGTPNMINNNGGRYRAPVDLRKEDNNGITRSNILPRGNNNYDFNNNYENRNNVTPIPPPRNIEYSKNDINGMGNYNDMNTIGRNYNNQFNNRNNNQYNNMNMNMNENNRFNSPPNNNQYMDRRYNSPPNNNQYMDRRYNSPPNNNQYMDNNRNNGNNVGIIDLNNMDSDLDTLNPNNNNNINNLNNKNNNVNDPNMNKDNRNNMNVTPNNNNNLDNNNNVGVNKDGEEKYEENEYQGQVQSNYHVNPYNPYSRPDFYLMNK